VDVIGSREIAAGVEPAHRNGKAATSTGGLAHDVSILLGVGRHLGSHPREAARSNMVALAVRSLLIIGVPVVRRTPNTWASTFR